MSVAVRNLQFGSGTAVFTPAAGNLAPNPTPIMLKVLQEMSVEFKGDTKMLYGNKQLPVAVARGKIDVSGKGKIAANDPNDINQLYFAQAVTSGGALLATESHTPGATVTPSQGSGLTVTSDQGVINGDTGKSMVRVASSPAVGQYSFTPAVTGGSPSAAEYVFNAGETASAVNISFTYSVTGGTSLTIKNQTMGYAPVLSLALFNNTAGKNFTLELNACMIGALSFPTKQEEFWVSDFDFKAFCDASDTLGTLYMD